MNSNFFFRILSALVIIYYLSGVQTVRSQNLQDARFEKLSSEIIRYEKGLSQNTVQCILQDRFGFLWFGTWDGLNKFDGYNYTVFNEESGLSNQNIQAIVEDRDGLLWIGTEDGLNCYDRETKEIEIFLHDYRNQNSLISNRVRTLMADTENNIWIGTNRGISVFNKNTRQFKNYQHIINDQNSLSSSWINDIFQDSKGNIWIATYRGLNRYLPKRDAFQQMKSGSTFSCLANAALLSVKEINDQTLVVGGLSGLFFVNFKSNSCRHYTSLPGLNDAATPSVINTLFVDNEGLLWIGTDGQGVAVYNPNSVEFVHFSNDPSDRTSLSNNRVYSIYQDRTGILWIGTFNGLNKYDRNSSKFRHHYRDPDEKQALRHNVVFGFFEDVDGNIWVGTEKGLSVFNPKTGKYSDLYFNTPIDKQKLNNKLIRCVFLDEHGNYWIPSRTGLHKYNKESGNIKLYTANRDDPGAIAGNSVWKLAHDTSGNLWIATERGLSRYLYDSDNFISYYHNPSYPESLPDNCVYDLLLDDYGTLWIATKEGLCFFNEEKNSFTQPIKEVYPHLKNNQLRIQNISKDNNYNIWIGTMGGGLLRYNINTRYVKIYTEKDGLPNNVVYRPVIDDEDNLWVPTNKGIAKFNIANESFTAYDFKDGLQSNEFNLGASLKASSGMLYFGGMNGFNEFHPNEIRMNNKPPTLVISGFRVFNQLVKNELFDNDTIILNHSDNFFSFEFSALDYANPSKNQYRYFLENFERDWTLTTASNRVVAYTNVPPGTYVFRMKGSNNDGIWNEEGIAVTVIITPAWYATLWFRALAAAIGVFLIWLVIYSRIKRIKRKHTIEKKVLEIEKQYYDLEQKALRLQMNPHFIFNTLNSIQSYVVNNEPDKAIAYMAIFARLMRQILSNSSLSYIALKDEITALQYYIEIEKLRFEEKFDHKLIIEKNIDDEFIGIPPMIIQPYVENAIIHGLMHLPEKGLLTIEIKMNKKSITCIIEDNGVGRERSMKIASQSGITRKSRGMMITRQRLELLNRYQEKDEFKVTIVDLVKDDNQPAGTRVELQIPFRDL